MKKFLIVPLLLTGISMTAQPSVETIKKHKIHFYQEYYGYKDASDERSSIAIWWFDRKGNDSLVYRYYDTLMPVYTYKNGKLMNRTYRKPDGKESTYDYEYKADGSYKVTYIDDMFGMKSYEWFDKKNKILKSQSPDGNTTTYKYDAKGRLLLVSSDGKNGGIKLSKKYTYNTKGQLSRLDYKQDENSSVITYEYNAKGQLVKEKEKGKESGTGFVKTTNWEYNDKGLASKKTSDKNDDEKEWQKVNGAFDYKYY